MLGTAGHVDHGKTALVKLLTGCQTDRLAEEQKRGLTIEIGFAPCQLGNKDIVGVVDVPGHVDFIRNMVAGAHGVDVVIFVIAADDGVMPQSREHLDILTLMGCRSGLVALTKVDLVDPELQALAVDEVRQFVRGTFLADAPICPISNITGQGFDGFFSALNQAVADCRPRRLTSPFKLWVERTFGVHGFGSVVTGVPSTGQVRVGDKLRLVGTDHVARLRRLEVYGQESDLGRAGECVAMNLADVPAEAIFGGSVLSGGPIEPSTFIETELTVLPHVPTLLKDYLEVHVHVGTAEAMGNLAILNDRKLPPGESRLVQLRLREPLPVTPGERFVIRGSAAGLAEGRVTTLGGGRVLDVTGIKLRRNRPWTTRRLTRRAEVLDDPAAWAAQVLAEASTPLDAGRLAELAWLKAEVAAELLDAMRIKGQAIPAGSGRFVHRRRLDELAAAIGEQLERFCRDNPLRMGLSADQLAERTDQPQEMVQLAVEKLTGDGKAHLTRGLARPAQMPQALDVEQIQLSETLADAFALAGLQPPGLPELAETFDLPVEKLQPIVELLCDQGLLVDLGKGIYMHRDAVGQGRQQVLALFGRSRWFTTMDFRDALGVSRKYAVPLLDHLDATRWTVRTSNRRSPGHEARKHLDG